MKRYFHVIFLFFVGCFFTSCQKEFYSSSSGDKLSFSSDSVRFDTIFTEKGSITQCVKIKNNCKGIVKINKIYLAKQNASEFYFNVNGTKGPVVENIDIDAGDSVFVFVQTKLKNQNVMKKFWKMREKCVEISRLSDVIFMSQKMAIDFPK